MANTATGFEQLNAMRRRKKGTEKSGNGEGPGTKQAAFASPGCAERGRRAPRCHANVPDHAKFSFKR
jgi:hypothetical protein